MKHSNSRATADPLGALRDDIFAIKQDLTQLLNGRFTEMSDATKETISKASTAAKDKAKDVHQGLSKAAAERPLTYLATALVVGALSVKIAGWFSSRR